MKQKLKRVIALRIAKLLAQFDKDIQLSQRPKFANDPIDFSLSRPYRIVNSNFIEIGEGADFGPGCFLAAITSYPPKGWAKAYDIEQEHFTPRISIGDRVSATGNVIISACKEIVIENDVLLASNINITDAFHGYDNVSIPFKFQKMKTPKSIHIGEGSWIGENCAITPGVRIGKFCIIGANSVVNSNIPDRSIAVGAPAKVIKLWNEDKDTWM